MAGMSEMFDKAVDSHMPPGGKESDEPSLSDLLGVASPEEAELLNSLADKLKGGEPEEPAEEPGPPGPPGL